jgi:hypothetical protein
MVECKLPEGSQGGRAMWRFHPNETILQIIRAGINNKLVKNAENAAAKHEEDLVKKQTEPTMSSHE